MADLHIQEILRTAKGIAIIGLSDKHDRDSYIVASYLQDAGYEIIPINPNIREWNGITAYASLREVPGKTKIDIIDIFRKNEFVDGIVDNALSLKQKPKAIWMQLGIENEIAAQKASAAGIVVIQNKCIKIEHRKMGIAKQI